MRRGGNDRDWGEFALEWSRSTRPEAVEPIRQTVVRLARSLNYTPDDLAENRIGRLTRRQRRLVARRIVLDALLWILGGLAGAGLVVLPMAYALIGLVTGVAIGDSLFILCLSAPYALLVVLALRSGVSNSRMADLLAALRAPAPVRRTLGEVRQAGGTREVMMGAVTCRLTARVPATSLHPGPYAVYTIDIPARPPLLLSAEPFLETVG